jgi:hypothetical protein
VVHRRVDSVARLCAALLDRRASLGVALALGVGILLFGDDAATRKNEKRKAKDRARAMGEDGGRDKKTRKRRSRSKDKEKGKDGGKEKDKDKDNAKVGTAAQGAPRARRGLSRNCDGVELSPGADLSGCDLRGRADLAGADLRRANLAEADLRGVDATGTDFSDAKLEDADLSEARLTSARFRGARLWRTRLVGAVAPNADFAASRSGRTDLFASDFTDADLLGASLRLEDVLYARYAVFCRTTMPNGSLDSGDCFANG